MLWEIGKVALAHVLRVGTPPFFFFRSGRECLTSKLAVTYPVFLLLGARTDPSNSNITGL